MDQNLATLLSALIGGILAIAGGFVANYVTGKAAEKNERIVFIRSKLEELYIIIGEMQSMHEYVFKNLVDVNDEEMRSQLVDHLNKLNLLLKRFEIITSLYMHSLHEELKKLFTILNRIVKEVSQKYSNNEKYTEQDKENYLKLTSEAYREIYGAISSFCKRKGISKI